MVFFQLNVTGLLFQSFRTASPSPRVYIIMYWQREGWWKASYAPKHRHCTLHKTYHRRQAV